jgi:hypothetical protein
MVVKIEQLIGTNCAFGLAGTLVNLRQQPLRPAFVRSQAERLQRAGHRCGAGMLP